ncbi:MAG: DUF86 domain-containing protein [Spirochaetes bacterium]|nr:DUF86 domain-containing protein [Spirochaetota bacterium]
MLDAARTIREFTSGTTFRDFEKDRKLQLAIERLLEILGEAARRVSEEFQKEHSEIPWRKIIGQRNVLAHEYGEIKLERIWVLVTENVVDLQRILEALSLDP